ncbi:hypothetical protein [Clostridium botulinum]|nr:hypothetical protein [Clostridium botulinum]
MKKISLIVSISASIYYFYKYREVIQRYQDELIDLEFSEDFINLIKWR